MSVAMYRENSHTDISTVERRTLYPGQVEAASLLRRWVKLETPGVYLNGPPGRGKTWLAMRAGWYMMRLGTPVLFVKTKRMLDDLRAFERNQGPAWLADSPERTRRRLYEAPVLILDDLGAARSSEYTREELLALFDHRWEHRGELSTLVTSNLTGNELVDHFGERTVSRLAGLCVAASVTGPDHRTKPTTEGKAK